MATWSANRVGHGRRIVGVGDRDIELVLDPSALLVSVARTVIVTVPTSALAGVPLKVRVAPSKMSQAGRPLAVYVKLSPASTSLNVLAANWKLNGRILGGPLIGESDWLPSADRWC